MRRLDRETIIKMATATAAILLMGGAVGACMLMSTFLAERIPPYDMTVNAMIETIVRAHMYMKEHREYPPSLAVLPKREGYANDIADGWDRELIYRVSDDGTIILTSLGEDGQPGGEGNDQDIVKKYRTKNQDGSWNIDDTFWIIYSEVREEDPSNEAAEGTLDSAPGPA